ncbi:hypothetical protein ACSVDA_15735 [Cytobacillus sp. Hm23]
MNTRLILIEGLPGFGKSTTATIIHELLMGMNVETELFLEGNLDHPADYDGVSFFSKNEFDELLSLSNLELKNIFMDRVKKKEDNYFLPYRKIENELNTKLSEELFNIIFHKDIYEISLDQNIELITEKWREFTETALNSTKPFIFDCCFIQNPTSIGMMKYDASKEKVTNYVMRLAEIIEPLNPLLIYIEQDSLEFSFKKAVKERPAEWSEVFIDYTVNQGYGKRRGYSGLDGTLKVLQARQQLELHIYDMLKINKVKVNNSKYESNKYKLKLGEVLKRELIL